MKLKKRILSLVLMSAVALVGCSNPTQTTVDYKPTVIEKKQENKYESKTVDFNLGDRELVTSTNVTMPYKLRGTMSIPLGEGKFPLIFVVHGNHNNEIEDKRYDIGFDYLTKKLAENGYIAIALDLNQSYMWKYGDNDEIHRSIEITKQHLKALKDANKGIDNGYTIDLKDKIDMSKIGLVGHSVGGEIIIELADALIQQGESVTSLLDIAPAVVRVDIKYLKNDIDTAILVPELDGDARGLDGYGVYDILNSKKRENLLSLTLLENANHNYFNREVEKNDAIVWTETKNIDNQLSRQAQEEFLENFAVDFFDASMKGKVENTIYDKSTPSSFKMYGYDVKSLLTDKEIQNIVEVDQEEAFVSEGTTVEATQYSLFFKDDKTNRLRIPTTSFKGADIKKLINLKWEKINSKVSFKPAINDFSNKDSLYMDVLVDPSDKLNPKGENQSFSIEIKDKKGNTSKVQIGKDVQALEYIDGVLEITNIFEEEVCFWSNPTPLTTIKLPMNIFKGVDLNNIQEVSIIFDKTDTGSIMISKIAVD